MMGIKILKHGNKKRKIFSCPDCGNSGITIGFYLKSRPCKLNVFRCKFCSCEWIEE